MNTLFTHKNNKVLRNKKGYSGGGFSTSHCKQFFSETNLESPFQHQDEIKKKPRRKVSLKKK